LTDGLVSSANSADLTTWRPCCFWTWQFNGSEWWVCVCVCVCWQCVSQYVWLASCLRELNWG